MGNTLDAGYIWVLSVLINVKCLIRGQCIRELCGLSRLCVGGMDANSFCQKMCKHILGCKQKPNGETMIDAKKFVRAMKPSAMTRRGIGYVGLLEWKAG